MSALHIVWKHQLLPFVVCAGLATLLLLPIASTTDTPWIMDFIHHLNAIAQAKIVLTAGQFPLRVVPFDNEHWLYPLFQFYSSTTYTITGFIHQWLTPTNPFIAYQITIWVALVIGGMYMNRLAYWFVKSRPAAILAAMVYLSAPYLIIAINSKGALSEILALGILPAVLYYTLQRYYHPKIINLLLQCAFVWYLLATIHLITFICTSFFVASLLLLITFKHYKSWINLLDAGIAYAFGCLLAMWHLGPIVVFGKFLYVTRTFNTIAEYAPALADLISPLRIQLNTITKGITNIILTTHPNIGLPIGMAFCICFYAMLKKQHVENARGNYFLNSLLILFVLAFLLTWTPINFWQYLPSSLTVIQYSWRFLGQIAWIGALLFAWAMCWLFKNKLISNPITLVILGVMIVISTSAWLIPPREQFHNYSTIMQKTTNGKVYLIDPLHSRFITVVDNTLIHSPEKERLNLLTLPPLLIPPSLSLSVQGYIPKKNNVDDLKIAVMANGAVIATYPIKTGAFHWTIPAEKNKSPRLIQFKAVQENINQAVNSKLIIPVKKLTLQNFLPRSIIMDAKQVQSQCLPQKNGALCKVNVPKNKLLLELPVFYYPDMLNITINGQLSPYFAVLYQNELITAVMPQAGKINNIDIQFSGLLWANYLSAVFWGVWVLFLFYITLRRILVKPILS